MEKLCAIIVAALALSGGVAHASAAPPTLATDRGYVEGSSPSAPVVLSATLVHQEIDESAPVSCGLPADYLEVELSGVTADMAVLRVSEGDQVFLAYAGTELAVPTGAIDLPAHVTIEAFDTDGYRSQPVAVTVEDVDDRTQPTDDVDAGGCAVARSHAPHGLSALLALLALVILRRRG